MSDSQIVHEFEHGRVTIRATISTFRGQERLDIREYFEASPGAPLAPTKKGINLPVAYIQELSEAVSALSAAILEPGRTHPPRRASRKAGEA